MTNDSKPLSREEYERFETLRKRVLFGGCVVFAYAVCVAIMVNLFHFEPNLFIIMVSFPIPTIWTLFQMFKYKCPRCGTTPMVKRLSFGFGEVEAGSYVALSPKKCLKCSVLFAPPQEEAPPIS